MLTSRPTAVCLQAFRRAGSCPPTLVAIDVPSEQFVAMRVVFPRELLTSTDGARVEPGPASAGPEATLQNATPSASPTAASHPSAEATTIACEVGEPCDLGDSVLTITRADETDLVSTSMDNLDDCPVCGSHRAVARDD